MVNLVVISEATEADIEQTAQQLCAEQNQHWEQLTEEQRQKFRIEASFRYSWLCE